MKLNKVKKKLGTVDFGIYWTVLIIVVIGIIMVYSSSAYYSLYHKDGRTENFVSKEAMWAVIGTIAMTVTMSIDYHIYKIKKWIAPAAYIVMIGLLCLVFTQGDVNGATRWIFLPGGLTFQPSEIAKYVAILCVALWLDKIKVAIRRFVPGVFIPLVISGIFAVLIIMQPNMSISAIIMIATVLLIYIGGANLKHLISIGLVLLAGGIALIFSATYRAERFFGFLNPWADASGDSFQLIQSFYALGSGGLTGVGLGQSAQKFLYMPEPYNDFIFAIYGEEFGFIGCVALIILFGFLIFRGISVASKAGDRFGLLLASGITCIIAIQVCVNIAVVTGSMPVTGVPLPFISYGGTSLVINMAAMGVLLNISRQPKGKAATKNIIDSNYKI